MENRQVQNGSYAAVTGKSLSVELLQVREIEVKDKDFKKYTTLLRKEGDRLRLTPPKEVIENTEKRTIIYRTLNMASKKVEIAAVEVVEEMLERGERIDYILHQRTGVQHGGSALRK
uniref:Uncharacterized protein n=1 Tax=Octopus bimaculoides TaxID=37653 RepID=A0A0L8IC13_OCTBM